ncbi:hypothetical protein [Puniceicoccus vermicola]|uniref:DUF3108 domain-containing protein n=1 Tax=Puniceicoccus vermicola TaxID=388746 RepID=A0A7X1E4I6_9BACT|nr:hypothetical protein [Puniceicoccus vermicola]MBC2600652.1 hypothetical protein [Puniceicoccus vermicola]
MIPRSSFWILPLFLLGICAFSLTSTAQEGSYEFEFRVFGLHPGNYKGIYYLNPDGDPEALQFDRRQRSVFYHFRADFPVQPLRFFRIIDDGGEGYFQTVAEITPNPSWSEVLLLFTDPPQSEMLKVYPAEDDEEEFPFGSLRVINLTSIPLGGSIDKQTENIAPGQWTDAFSIQRPGKVDVLFAAATSDSVHLVYRKSMPLWKDSRTLLILRPPARSGSIRIGATTLQDFESQN